MPIDAPSSVTVAMAVAEPHRPWPFPHTLPATLGRITPLQRRRYNRQDRAKEGLDTKPLARRLVFFADRGALASLCGVRSYASSSA